MIRRLSGSILIVFFVVLLAALLFRFGRDSGSVVFFPDGNKIRVEIADSPEERQKGLMFRDTLSDGNGMLFVFEEEQPLSFWMKNTLLPLDILFLDDEKKIVSIHTMTPCRVEPCPLTVSGAPAKYALEINARKAEDLGVTDGDILSF